MREQGFRSGATKRTVIASRLDVFEAELEQAAAADAEA
jgi:hypothetical protein